MPVQHIGHQLIILDSVDSSNNYAMALTQQRLAGHGDTFFALEQKAGKGQMGRRWISRPNENIIISIVLETTALAPDMVFYLSMAMALGTYDWFAEIAGEESSLKWPNDIYWRDRKAGGILIENNWAGPHWQFAIVGIGINVNQVNFEEGTKKPVSLRQITGKSFDLQVEVRKLCEKLEYRWNQLVAGKKKELLESYNQVLFSRGMPVRLRKDNMVFETTIRGVNENGELLTSDTLDRCFRVGEVEWV